MKKQTQKRFIYIRYILPSVLALAVIGSMLIPSYVYVVGGEVDAAISPLALISNSVETTRQVLFGGETRDGAEIAFSQTLLWMLGIFFVLALVSLVATVYATLTALIYFNLDDESRAEEKRAIFRALFPNRAVLLSMQALALPLALFPYILPAVYKSILGMSVTLVYAAPDTLLVYALSLVGVCVASCLSAPMERRFDADLFKARQPFEKKMDEEYHAADNGQTDRTLVVDTSAKREQNERIRKLLLNAERPDEEEQN